MSEPIKQCIDCKTTTDLIDWYHPHSKTWASWCYSCTQTDNLKPVCIICWKRFNVLSQEGKMCKFLSIEHSMTWFTWICDKDFEDIYTRMQEFYLRGEDKNVLS